MFVLRKGIYSSIAMFFWLKRYCKIGGSVIIEDIKEEETFPDGHRFQQDNDRKHTGRREKTFMENNSINCWKMLPESPDLNPIELVWQELKHFLHNMVKPHTKEELIDGITRF